MTPAQNPELGENTSKGDKDAKKPSYRGITVRNSAYSESYDEYLECIYRLSLKNPAGWVKNIQISRRLKVKAPSVTNMLEKLAAAEFIDWKPRSGIRLTENGRKRAKELVFYHSIMELFLIHVLGMKNKEKINSLACDFEHHLTPELSERLIDLLGISSDLKNVDNFISEDNIPNHIKIRQLYTENQVKRLLDDFFKTTRNLLKNKNIDEETLSEVYTQFTKQKFPAT